jgi:hypothetical protein
MDELAELNSELLKKFPLLENILFSSNGNYGSSQLPLIVPLLASMTDVKTESDICALIPAKKEIASFVSILVALSEVSQNFESRFREYVSSGFIEGDKVRVLPSGHVYEYAGLFEGHTEFFKLREIGTIATSRSFPINEIVRVEKTSSLRPKGKGNTNLGEHIPSILDRMINIGTGGNNALLKNEVMLITTKKAFLEFLDNTLISRKDGACESFSLHDVIPWGIVTAEGDIDFSESKAASGQPLIAISSRMEYVALACKRGILTSPRVIIDATNGLINSLQAFDDLVDYSKLLVLVDHTQTGLLHEVYDRNCKVWKFPEQLAEQLVAGSSILKDVNVRCMNSSTISIHLHACQSDIIELIADKIFLFEKNLQKDSDEESLKLIAILYSRLLDISSLFNISPDFLAWFVREMDSLKNKLKNQRGWLPTEAYNAAAESLHLFEECIGGHSNYLDEKIKKFELLLIENSNRQVYVVSEFPRVVSSIKEFVGNEWENVSVCSSREVTVADSDALIILTGWPKASNFQKIINEYSASKVHILAFSFEHVWFKSSVQRRKRELNSWTSKSEDLKQCSNLNVTMSFQPEIEPDAVEPNISSLISFENRISNLRKGGSYSSSSEENREAHYVGFVGKSYALLLESYKLPIITGLVLGRTDGTNIPLKTLDEIEVGDYVIFRTNTDKDIVRFIAETGTGTKKYSAIRDIAKSWKEVLNGISGNFQIILSTLKSHGYDKSEATLNNWLHHTDLIGPGAKSDLMIISAAAKNDGLKKNIDKVWSSISKIRGWHLAAGFKLSKILNLQLPKQLDDMDQDEKYVELTLGNKTLGEVVVLKIEKIDKESTLAAISKINKLLIED